jgi:transposase
MSKKLSQSEYDAFKKRAVALSEEKQLSQCQIADLFGVGQPTVSRWLRQSKSGDVDWHKSKRGSGAPPKLSAEQFLLVLEELKKGAVAHGFEGEYWTTGRASEMIERVFGVKYDPDHLGRKLGQANWSFKNPRLKARQQSAEQVEQWHQNRLPNLKKS